MSESLNQVRTAHGLLDAKVETTIHCDWLTYPHRRELGRLGLESIVEATYGHPLELLDVENGTQMSAKASKGPLSTLDQDTLDKAVASGALSQYALRIVLADLCNKNVLPAAHYVVGVSW